MPTWGISVIAILSMIIVTLAGILWGKNAEERKRWEEEEQKRQNHQS